MAWEGEDSRPGPGRWRATCGTRAPRPLPSYNAYWEDHLALLAPGGVDVFVETDHDVLRGAGPQWAVDHSENFYIPEEGDLPIPIPYQTRVWVENFTRDSRNAWSAGNRSALYHIVSMKAEEPVPGQGEGDSLYSLLAFCDGRAEAGEGGWLSAVLLFDQETGQVGDVLAWAQGDREEVAAPPGDLGRPGGAGPADCGILSKPGLLSDLFSGRSGPRAPSRKRGHHRVHCLRG